jgi:hypothetical protein
MDRVEEIEAAIASLPPEEFRRIAQWFYEDQSLWDEQLEATLLLESWTSFLKRPKGNPRKVFSVSGHRRNEVRRNSTVRPSSSIHVRSHALR